MASKELINRIGSKIYDLMYDNYEVREGEATVSMTYCERAAEKCIDAKEDIIKMLSNHPNWDADNLRVHFSADFVRPTDFEKAHYRVMDIGETLSDVYHFYDDEELANFKNCSDIRRLCDTTIEYHPGYPLYNLGVALQCSYAFDKIFLEPNITKEGEEQVKALLPDARIHEGAKSTRALYKLLCQYGFEKECKGRNMRDVMNLLTGEITQTDDLDRIRKKYTEYADFMNPLTIKRHTVLSVNPMDFLLMSHGNSWSSCHYISDNDGDDSGCYSAGCWSYAYDKQTMIFYTVDGDEEDNALTYAGKYTRQLFFWNGQALMPSRLYPAEDNLGDPAYAQNRAIVEQIIADSKGFGNMWRRLSKKNSANADIKTFGLHYPDYRYHTYPIYVPSFVETEDDAELSCFEIGSNYPICVCCGDRLDDSNYPICSHCKSSDNYECSCCHDYFSYDEDGRWINGEWVCESCIENYYRYDVYNEEYINEEFAIYVENYGYVHEDTVTELDDVFFYCEDCNRYFFRAFESPVETRDRLVCQYCAEEHYAVCERCGDLVNTEDILRTEDGKYICRDCIEDDEAICPVCGHVYRADTLVDSGTDDVEEPVCPECYEKRRFFCEECGKVYYEYGPDSTDTYSYTPPYDIQQRGIHICSECLNKAYFNVGGGYYKRDGFDEEYIIVSTYAFVLSGFAVKKSELTDRIRSQRACALIPVEFAEEHRDLVGQTRIEMTPTWLNADPSNEMPSVLYAPKVIERYGRKYYLAYFGDETGTLNAPLIDAFVAYRGESEEAQAA